MTGFVYFITNSEAKAVKIGFATDVAKRMSVIGVSSPHRLELGAKVPGTMIDEGRLHCILANQRMSGEWFRWDIVSHELIEAAKAGATIEQVIELADSLTAERERDPKGLSKRITAHYANLEAVREGGCLVAEIEEQLA